MTRPAVSEETRLTEYADLHGCSCKIGQSNLEELLASAGLVEDHQDLLFGVGEDAGARRLRDDLAMVQTVDFFTPIIDDPYQYGRIAACNALSDAFATGATADLSCLVVMGLPRELTDVAPDILVGMSDALDEVDGAIVGGHTTVNPWPVAGGAITATADPKDLLTTAGASPGDRLFLTKPLGVQAAMGAHRVGHEFESDVQDAVDRPLSEIVSEAVAWMTTPNRQAALAATEHASACTDVTGFGLLGQARVIAANADVGVEITAMPVIDGTPALSALFGYGLEDGESAETSGGLLMAVPEDQAITVQSDCERRGVFAMEVGEITSGSGASLVNPTIEPVSRERSPI